MEQDQESDTDKALANRFRLRYGGKYCAVVGCHNSTYRDVPRGVKFHSFPKDPERREAWIHAINRAPEKHSASLWQPKTHDVICSEHFFGKGFIYLYLYL